MKRSISIFVFAMIGIMAYGQSYDDFFTTYESAPRQSTQQQSYGDNQNGVTNNNGVAQYDVIDANKYMQSIGPQNVQVTNGVFVHNGQFYSVKLKVGISGTNQNQIIVCGYWDGQMWNKSNSYASAIGYGAPDQIKRACTHQVYISSLGTVYF